MESLKKIKLLLCCIFYTATSFCCDINIQVIQTGSLALQNGNALCTLRVFNYGASANTALSFTVNTGNFFKGNSIISPATASLSNTGFPDPVIDIAAGAIPGSGGSIDVVLEFSINESYSCNIVSDFSNQPYKFNTFNITYGGCGTITDLNASAFYVYFPKFKINFAEDPSYTYINQVIYRKVEVINNGNADYDITLNGGIKIQNNHNPDFEILDIAKEIAPNTYADLSATIVNPTSNSEYEIDAADFYSLMSNSYVLPQFPSQTLTYYEKIKILQCSNSISSQLTPYWEVNSQWCATNAFEQSYLNRILIEPQLAVTAAYINPPRDYCYGSSNENDIQIKLSNALGSSYANNLSVHLFKGAGLTPDFTEILSNTFIVKRTVAGVTTTLSSPADYTITPSLLSTSPHCDGQFYFGDYIIAFDPSLTLPNGPLASNNITIDYKIRTCCPGNGTTCFTQDQYYDSWRVNASYGGFCDGVLRLSPTNPGTPVLVSGNFAVGNTGGFSYDGPFNIFVPWGFGSPPAFSQPYDVTFSYTGSSGSVWPYNTANYQFYIDVTLESDLVFCGTAETDFTLVSTALGSINPSSPTFISGSNIPGIVKTIRLYFDLTTNMSSSLLNSDLKFCIKGHCPNSVASIAVSYYYVPDGNCTACALPFACYLQPLTVQCPGCLRQGIHSDSYRISRTTFGLVDANNNGRWDGGSPTQITPLNAGSYSGLKKKRVMVGDEFEGVLKTHVELNGYQPNAWSYNGSTPPQLDFFNGYWHSSYTYGENISPLNAWVQIIEHETTAVCTSPPCTTVLNLPPPQIFDPVNDPINPACYGGISGTDFYYDFSFATLQAINPGVPDIPTRYSHGMELEFHHTFRQDTNVGPDFILNEAKNLIYLTLRPETNPNVYGVVGGCPQDPDIAVAAYASANCIGNGFQYDSYCNGTTNCPPGTTPPFACEDIQWFCTRQGDTYTQVGFNASPKITTVNINSTGCTYYFNGYTSFLVGPDLGIYNRTNAFPFEYRNWNYLDHIDFTFPAGFTPLGVTLQHPYTNSGYPNVPQNATQATNLTTLSVTNLTSTSCTVELGDLTDDGSEGAYPGWPITNTVFFGPPDDDYYFDSFHVSFAANCNVPDGGTDTIGSITWTEYHHYAPQLLNSYNTNFSHPITAEPDPFTSGDWNIYHNSPDLTIQNQTPNVSAYGFNDPVSWTVLVTNTTTGVGSQFANAKNVWLGLGTTMNSSGSIAIESIEVLNPVTLNYELLVDASGISPGIGNYDLDNLYYIPATMPAGSQTLAPNNAFYTYKVTASNVNCSQGDELEIRTGWMCSQRLNTLIEYQNLPCANEVISDVLHVDPTPSDLRVCVNGNGCDLNYVPVNAQPCSTVTYDIRIESHDVGFLDAINFQMNLLPGSGLTFLGSAIISYQGNILGSITPSGSNLSFDLTDPIFSIIAPLGLPGLLNPNYLDPDDHFIMVSVTLQTGCEFTYNLDGGFQLNIDAFCCQQPVPQQYEDFYNPVLESPTFAYDNMIVDLSTATDPLCPNVINSSATVTNNSPVASNTINNVLHLDTPPGITLSNFSIPPTNPLGPAPFIWSPSILGGLVNGSSLTITFDMVADNISCGTYEVTSSLFTDDLTTCLMQPCSVIHALQDETTGEINIIPPSSAFTLPTINPCTGVSVSFSPDVICAGVTYEWNIDGSLYTGANVSHTFSLPGAYNVTLTSSLGIGGCFSTTGNIINIDTCGHPCIGTDFTISLDNCDATFTGIAPPSYSSNCDEVMYQWNFGDMTPVGPYSLSNIATHTYSNPGNYTVCMAAICFDVINDTTWEQIEYCKQCHDIVVSCDRQCEGAYFTADIKKCTVDFAAFVPNLTGCASIEYAWGFGDGSGSGLLTTNTTSHTYLAGNTYEVCFEAYCKDANGNVIYTCKFCEEIKVECEDCDDSKLSYKVEGCEVKLTASVPQMSNCYSVEYAWDLGDGNTLPASAVNESIVYQFCESGKYKVCYEAFCLDKYGRVIYSCNVCKEIEVKCAEPFCIKIENPAVGSLTGVDVAKTIQSTPDNGYVIVGTVNASNTNATSAANEGDTYFVKYDQNNNIEFQYRLGETTSGYINERGSSVLVRPDGYYVAGITYKNYGVDHDIQVTKILLDGTIAWGKRYGYNNNRKDEPVKLVDMSDGVSENILVVGSSNNSGNYNSPFDISATNHDFLAFVIEPVAGNLVAALRKKYSYTSANTASEYARDAIRIEGLNGPEYIIAGEYAPCTTGCTDRDGYIIKIDQSLNLLASQRLSLANRIEYVSSAEHINGNIIVGGASQLIGSNEQIWLAELNAADLTVQSSVLYDNNNFTDSRVFSLQKPAGSDKLLIAGRTMNGLLYNGVCLQIDPSDAYSIDWSNFTNNTAVSDHFTSVSDRYLLTGQIQEAAPFNSEIFISKMCPENGNSCCLVPIPFKASAITYSNLTSHVSTGINLNTIGVISDVPVYPDVDLCPGSTRSIGELAYRKEMPGTILIYPNPSKGEFTVKAASGGVRNIEIRDLSGRLVKMYLSTDITDKSIFIVDASDLISGIYFIEIMDSDHQKHISKISIQK